MLFKSLKWVFVMSYLGLAGMITAQTAVHWLTWEEAISKSENEPRKFFVDVYTDWCGWCKKMDQATFNNSQVAEYLNAHYYPIKFNAEYRDEIRIHNESYQFVRGGRRGYHELAKKITFGRMSYPTVVFMDENLEVIQPIPGFREADEFQMMLEYFGEDHHKTTPWTKFASGYERN